MQKTKEHRSRIAELQQIIFGVLEWLWDVFVEPIFSKLGYIGTGDDCVVQGKVWWCLTRILSYLPIHAAGYHNSPSQGRTVIDHVISCYTSSIKALKYSRDRADLSEGKNPLIVAMPHTPGHRDLPLAEDEGYRIKYILANTSQPDYMENLEVDAMCKELPERSIVHLICHVLVEEANPSKSRILLKDGSLTVAHISRLKIPPGAMAYLSACSTALSQAESLDDERITLNTAFQVAGFAGVVGCLWKADDEASFYMATSFYNHLQGDNARAAEALHRGVLELRKQFPKEPSIWAPYMYTGA